MRQLNPTAFNPTAFGKIFDYLVKCILQEKQQQRREFKMNLHRYEETIGHSIIGIDILLKDEIKNASALQQRRDRFRLPFRKAIQTRRLLKSAQAIHSLSNSLHELISMACIIDSRTRHDPTNQNEQNDPTNF